MGSSAATFGFFMSIGSVSLHRHLKSQILIPRSSEQTLPIDYHKTPDLVSLPNRPSDQRGDATYQSRFNQRRFHGKTVDFSPCAHSPIYPSPFINNTYCTCLLLDILIRYSTSRLNALHPPFSVSTSIPLRHRYPHRPSWSSWQSSYSNHTSYSACSSPLADGIASPPPHLQLDQSRDQEVTMAQGAAQEERRSSRVKHRAQQGSATV